MLKRIVLIWPTNNEIMIIPSINTIVENPRCMLEFGYTSLPNRATIAQYHAHASLSARDASTSPSSYSQLFTVLISPVPISSRTMYQYLVSVSASVLATAEIRNLNLPGANKVYEKKEEYKNSE